MQRSPWQLDCYCCLWERADVKVQHTKFKVLLYAHTMLHFHNQFLRTARFGTDVERALQLR